jgi:anti-anti-sigma factor
VNPVTGDGAGRASDSFTLRTSKAAGFVRISVRGTLDRAAARALHGTVRQVLVGGASEVIIDLSDVTHIDAHGVESLLAERDACALEQVALRFARPAANVQAVLDDPRIQPPLSFTA